ncbi:6594_t:CDS:2, partial [Cetraspora pellucida]
MSLERNKYPENNPFSLKQNHTKYTYNIINEGHYSLKNILRYILTHSSIKAQYKISDGYLVETSWGRKKSKHKVECEIEYESDGPIFRIRFEENSQQISGVHVFGLNAMDVEQKRKKKEKENQKSFSFKPFNVLSESMKTKCSRAFSLQM